MIFASIEAERARKGLTKEELAKKMGVSVKTYYNWINGRSPIPSNVLIEMSVFFGVTIDYLLKRSEPEKEAV